MSKTECSKIQIQFHPQTTIEVKADAPQISSDGGLLLVRQADEALGISQKIASCLKDDRQVEKIKHSKSEQVKQRIYQILMGYEDANDSDFLRNDPMFKTVCNETKDTENQLSSQPTITRMENSIDGKTLNLLINLLEDEYVNSLPKDTDNIVLDIDSTDDETHGQQQLSFFHGYYDHYMYHPLLVFDDKGNLVSVLLRPGKVHASRSAAIVLTRLIRKIRNRFASIPILIRGDSGFCVPRILERLDKLENVDYVFGIAKNNRLLKIAEPLIQEAKTRYHLTNEKVRYFSDFYYAANSWEAKRYLIVKAEHTDKGANPRFLVTTLDNYSPQMIYDQVYCLRGQCENYIKDFKNALNADRLSCHKFTANFFRLILHAAAYRIMHYLRNEARQVSIPMGSYQFDTLRTKLLKVAAYVKKTVRRVWIHLPKYFPLQETFVKIALRMPLATCT